MMNIDVQMFACNDRTCSSVVFSAGPEHTNCPLCENPGERIKKYEYETGRFKVRYKEDGFWDGS